MKERILITGATGFVGKHLVPALVSNGYQVLEVTRDVLKSKKLFEETTLKIIDSDIRFKEKIEDFQPEIVVHMASFLTASDEWMHIENMVNTNILFFTKVLDAVSRVDLKLFVNTGSFSEYSNGQQELLPAYYYSATKIASRAILDYYSRINCFKQVTVVPYTIYGGVDSQKKVIDLLYDSTLSDTRIDLSPGEQILDFVHIDDVTRVYISIISSLNNLPDKVNFKVGTGIGHSLKEVAACIEEITNRKTNINWGAKPYRKTDVMYAVADLSICKEILGWNPEIDLKSGIEKMIQVKEYKS